MPGCQISLVSATSFSPPGIAQQIRQGAEIIYRFLAVCPRKYEAGQLFRSPGQDIENNHIIFRLLRRRWRQSIEQYLRRRMFSLVPQDKHRRNADSYACLNVLIALVVMFTRRMSFSIFLEKMLSIARSISGGQSLNRRFRIPLLILPNFNCPTKIKLGC